MTELIKTLTQIDGISGDENKVREFIINEIKDYCEYKTDPLGNLLVFKKGKNKTSKKLMLDAHMDEVGLIITSITSEGFLKFNTVGGIDTATLMFKKVRINGEISGIISGKPIHLLSKEEAKTLPKTDSLYIDIGAECKDEAEKLVSVGDSAVVCGGFEQIGDKILSKALDDRIGCAILIKLIKEYDTYDFFASFSVQEELGLRGAKTASFSLDPEYALVLEGTTAADISGVSDSETVCNLGEGPAISFMDKATVYDRDLYNLAINSEVLCQPKRAVTGGNNSGAIHLSREGIKTLAISVPCRYIHTNSSVADLRDCENAYKLAIFMMDKILSGETK